MRSFTEQLNQNGIDLRPRSIETLQVNITKLCNQACTHCHVEAGPKRTEMMSLENINLIIMILKNHPQITTIDITGGAPELHPQFQYLVKEARLLKKKVLVRHNLTVTLDPHPESNTSMEYLPEFFQREGVELVSSLPYYDEYFTDRQRGKGVFQKSIESLKRLNALGYGVVGSGLTINLVYNPNGAFLPHDQKSLELKFKHELEKKYFVTFNSLFTITNMPINRFKNELIRLNTYQNYLEKLVDNFNATAAKNIMCKSLISVDFDGNLYDCDFNQMLNLPIKINQSKLKDFDYNKIVEREIVTNTHCYGCTAGSGSSCGGATT